VRERRREEEDTQKEEGKQGWERKAREEEAQQSLVRYKRHHYHQGLGFRQREVRSWAAPATAYLNLGLKKLGPIFLGSLLSLVWGAQHALSRSFSTPSLPKS
jgi:hypothetical protein